MLLAATISPIIPDVPKKVPLFHFMSVVNYHCNF